MKSIFHDEELKTLEALYQSDSSKMIVLYGRRRIGKTALIEHFIKEKQAIYFVASEESEYQNMAMLKNQIADFYHIPSYVTSGTFTWYELCNMLLDYKGEEKLILVLDEFQFLGKSNPSFPSILQKIWDTSLKNNNIMLILCGSYIGMMLSMTLHYDSPLYGRRDAQIRLSQISFSHYHEFFPNLSFEEQLEHYAITGGVPRYIELFDSKASLEEKLDACVFSKNSPLYEEPFFLLEKEVKDIGSYFTVMKMIAQGSHKQMDIAKYCGIKQTSLQKILTTLIKLDLLYRDVPADEKYPEKSKKGLYFIKDNFIAFWFLFVFPFRSYLEISHKEIALQNWYSNFVVRHLAYVYEEVCKEYLWRMASTKGVILRNVGRWWNAHEEIDILSYSVDEQTILFGECKYQNKQVGLEVYKELSDKAQIVKNKKVYAREIYILFSKSGFEESLMEVALKNENIWLVEGICEVTRNASLNEG